MTRPDIYYTTPEEDKQRALKREREARSFNRFHEADMGSAGHGGMKKAIPVIIDGVSYPSFVAATRATGIAAGKLKEAHKELNNSVRSAIEKELRVTRVFEFSKPGSTASSRRDKIATLLREASSQHLEHEGAMFHANVAASEQYCRARHDGCFKCKVIAALGDAKI